MASAEGITEAVACLFVRLPRSIPLGREQEILFGRDLDGDVLVFIKQTGIMLQRLGNYRSRLAQSDSVVKKSPTIEVLMLVWLGSWIHVAGTC